MNERPSTAIRLGFWLLLGMLSTASAEVTVSSQVAPFFTPHGWLLVFPVYLLHILVLGYFVVVRFRPTVALVWSGGILFGMYEFLITKVIWNPPWTDSPLMIAGVAIPEFVTLALFYHAFFAFLLPLWVAERTMTTSRSVPLPVFLSRFLQGSGAWLLPAAWGLVLGATAGIRIWLSLASFGVVAGAMWWWRRRGLARWTLADLMPQHREARWLIAGLAALYVATTVALRPEALPDPVGWVSLTVLYVVFIWLFVRVSKRPAAPTFEPVLRYRPMLIGGLVGVGLGVLVSGSVGPVLTILLIWGGGGIFGLVMLATVLRTARRSLGSDAGAGQEF